MLVGIHIDPHKGFTNMLERYEKILDFNDIEHLRLDASEPDFWRKVKKLDLFIFHWYGTERQRQMAQTILPVIEDILGIPCFPKTLMSWLYDDKVREYYFLQQHSYPVIPTWIFWDKEEALAWLEKKELPIVFKLSGGSSSENVILVKDKSHGKRLIGRMFGRGIVSGHIPGMGSLKWRNMFEREHMKRFGGKIKRRLKGEEGDPFEELHRDYILFQQFLPENTIDMRIHIIGKRAFGDIRYVREKDFRASGSGKMSSKPEYIDHRCIKIAYDIYNKFDLHSMTVDFLFDEDKKPLISEMSYTQPDWSVYEYPGYWDEKMNWHVGHYWPQYLILMDILGIPNLKQPEAMLSIEETKWLRAKWNNVDIIT